MDFHGFHVETFQLWEGVAPDSHPSQPLPKCSEAVLQRCKLKSILGIGFFTGGLDANISPGLDGLTHEFLALVGGISSSYTPGNGPFSEKQFPELGCQL